MKLEIQKLNTRDSDFWQQLNQLLAWDSASDEQVFGTVSKILKDVRLQGDSAVMELTARFDALQVNSMADLEMPKTALKAAFDGLPEMQQTALRLATDRIKRYAEKQKMSSWEYMEDDGTLLGQQVNCRAMGYWSRWISGGKFPSAME